MKRILALFVAAFLLFAVLPAVQAEEAETLSPLELEVIREARNTYVEAQRFAGRKSFHGRCGLMVNTQLRCLGINTKRISFHGKDSYDHYAQLDVTTGGYYAIAYSGNDYDLLGALRAVSHNGTKNVRNILVGFQWTNTEAGNKYGHVVLINGIINGTVYFVESFNSALGGPEGTVLQCSMEAFANSYNKWTLFEGLVHFGVGNYYDVCSSKITDVMIQARFDTTLRSQPALVGEKECTVLGSIAAGQQMQATAVFNDGRFLYYRVQTEDGLGYVSSNAVYLQKVNEEGIVLAEETLSRELTSGKQGDFQGTVTDSIGQIDFIEVCVTDSDGQPVRWEIAEVGQNSAQLSRLRRTLVFDLLEEGEYRVDIYAIRSLPAVVQGMDQYQSTRILLKSYALQVGT